MNHLALLRINTSAQLVRAVTKLRLGDHFVLIVVYMNQITPNTRDYLESQTGKEVVFDLLFVFIPL